MSDIVKKSESAPDWDPFRSMRDWLRWDPFREISPMMGRFEREWNPSFEVRENKEAFLIKADVPGVKKEDLEVTLSGNRLTITGKRDAEHETKGDTLYTYERSYGTFARAFTLPEGIDVNAVKTELRDGVLTLAIPKKPDAQARKIPISAGVTKS